MSLSIVLNEWIFKNPKWANRERRHPVHLELLKSLSEPLLSSEPSKSHATSSSWIERGKIKDEERFESWGFADGADFLAIEFDAVACFQRDTWSGAIWIIDVKDPHSLTMPIYLQKKWNASEFSHLAFKLLAKDDRRDTVFVISKGNLVCAIHTSTEAKIAKICNLEKLTFLLQLHFQTILQ
jgi:hypothetical protein